MNQLKTNRTTLFETESQVTKKGFTLIEVLVGLMVFAMLTTVASVAMVQTQKVAHTNVMHNSARTVVQGYMEQIKGIPYNELLACVNDPTVLPIPTKSVDTSSSGSDIIVDDSLFIDQANTKTILLDTVIEDDGSLKSQSMTLTIEPRILNIYNSMGLELLEITLNYNYTSAFSGISIQKSGSLRFVKTAVSEY